MSFGKDMEAWIEMPDGGKVLVEGSCAIGRSRGNQVVLPDARVSRRHAMIHLQGPAEHWLVDLGTMNGTRINGRRIFLPTCLRDGDEIDIAGLKVVFRQPRLEEVERAETTATAVTIQEIRRSQCWLLVVDVVSSTQLHQTKDPEQVPVILGRWFASLKEIIEGERGAINQYTGDGVLAVWMEPPERSAEVYSVIQSLRKLQQEGEPAFRGVLHYGSVSVTSSPQPGHESLVGNDAYFAFRMEELAKSLGLRGLVSEPAAQRLASLGTFQEAGRHALRKFEGEYAFFSF